jgi:hypothetical protein
METWILIMTIVAGTYSSPAIATVELYGRHACIAAGNQWLSAVRKYSGSASAVCVQKADSK